MLRNILGLMLLVFILFAGTIDLEDLFNYAQQGQPEYINQDNSGLNPVSDEGATLGRVLFYDKKLSRDNSVSCASCHRQEFAFSDPNQASLGVNGMTGRHSMRLINSRFGEEERFFWDERATSLEDQTTMPIQDHIEMGFSGENGDPDFNDLFQKLDDVGYYNDLFFLVFGDTVITEARIQIALAQFVRSIQSFDSKYDMGRTQVDNHNMPFPNFTQQENLGKTLYSQMPIFDQNGVRTDGGAGCASCHRPPEFDIDPNSLSNGIVRGINVQVLDTTVTRSPSLREVFNAEGMLNGPLMHNGSFQNMIGVINHYDSLPSYQNIPEVLPHIDQRLMPNGRPQNLKLTGQEKMALIAFLRTLSGTDIYTNPIWSDPFDENDDISVIGGPLSTSALDQDEISVKIYPNPAVDRIFIESELNSYIASIHDLRGSKIYSIDAGNNLEIDISSFPSGTYVLTIESDSRKLSQIFKKI